MTLICENCTEDIPSPMDNTFEQVFKIDVDEQIISALNDPSCYNCGNLNHVIDCPECSVDEYCIDHINESSEVSTVTTPFTPIKWIDKGNVKA